MSNGVVVKAAANRIFQEFRTDLLASYTAAPKIWPAYAMEIPSMSRSTMHAWLGDQAGVREWAGPRIAKGMSTRTWEVVNRKWELTYGFERDQIDDDLSGLVAAAVVNARGQGAKWAKHEDLHIAQVLEAGLTALCWDGQFFFDTDHPTDIDGIVAGTYSNFLAATALTFANFNTALVTMQGYKNEDGSPMVMPGSLTLMVPPALGLAAKALLETTTLTTAAAYSLFGTGGASQNPFLGAAKVVVNQYLTSTTRWFLMATGEPIKPIMLQRRRPLEVQDTGQMSELWFNEEKLQIGGSARYAASYTLPQLAICADA